MEEQQKYAIIGAGPSGLCTAKKMKDFDIPFDGYESAAEVGGLWNIDNKNSTVYESAHLISSKYKTEFKDFPMKEEVATYPHHKELRAYFNDFADHFDLERHYFFNTEVREISPEGKYWRLKTANGDSKLYKGVVIANGTLSHPNIPEFEGDFSGEIMHSKYYKNPAIFEGKRVLIVGAGNSGCDIAVDAVHRADKVSMSLRRGYHFVPKFVMGKPADTIGGKINFPASIKQKIDKTLLKLFIGNPQKYGFPEPDHKLYESHPIVNNLVLHHAAHGDLDVKADITCFDGSTVYFKDGKAEDYDIVLLATGYKLNYPFIDRKHLNWEGAIPQLYLNIFHPTYNNLFVMGMIEATGIGWEGRSKMAELVTKFISEHEKNSPKAAHFIQTKRGKVPDLKGGYKYLKLDRMAYYVHKDTYLKKVESAIKKLS